jgi:hypothetical protein
MTIAADMGSGWCTLELFPVECTEYAGCDGTVAAYWSGFPVGQTISGSIKKSGSADPVSNGTPWRLVKDVTELTDPGVGAGAWSDSANLDCAEGQTYRLSFGAFVESVLTCGGCPPVIPQ